MNAVVKYTFLLELQLLLCRCSASTLFLQKRSADQVLDRPKRANAGMEELYQGNLERECYEEICSKEEAREYFEDNGKTETFWKNYTDVNECKSSPCNNNAACENTIGSYVCKCLPGYEGKHCELDVDECQSSPCLHNGTCQNTVGSYLCHCTGGYEGQHCEADINECSKFSPCPAGFQCVDGLNRFTCVCPEEGCMARLKKIVP